MRRASGFDVLDLDVRQSCNRLGAFGRPSERAVLPVESGGAFAGEPDEPLASGAVGVTGPGHRDDPEIVRKIGAFDRQIPPRTTFAGAGLIAALDH